MYSVKVTILWIGYFSFAVFTFGGSGAVCASLPVLPNPVFHFDAPKEKVVGSSIIKVLGLALARVMVFGAYPVTVRGIASEYLCKNALASRILRSISNSRQGADRMENCRQNDLLLIPDLRGFHVPLLSINLRDRWSLALFSRGG